MSRFSRRATLVLLPLVLAATSQATTQAATQARGPTSGPDEVIDAKLARQFERYALARDFLIQGARDGSGAISRGQWELLITLPENDGFSAAEREALAARQHAAIEAARSEARERSALSLDAVREAAEVDAFCKDLPKGGMLHIHPSGTLDAETVTLLLEKVNPVFERRALLERVEDAPMSDAKQMLAFLEPYGPAVRYENLAPEDQAKARALFFWPPGTTVPQIGFGMVATLRDDSEFNEIVLRAFFARAQAHRVRYVEMAKSLKPNRPTLEALDRIDEIADEYDIVARFNVGLSRVNKERKNLDKVESWIEARDPGPVVGVDLYGREASAPNLDAGQRIYAELLDARELGRTRLRTTSHAAGLGEADNPRDAIVMGVERIGHGVTLRQDPVALEYARRRRTPIETNLTSNVQLNYVDSLSSHPFLDYLRLGLRVSLSTDDEGMLGTNISRECSLAVGSFDLEYAELRRMVENSIETSFADEALKARLTRQVADDLAAFEQRWSRFARP